MVRALEESVDSAPGRTAAGDNGQLSARTAGGLRASGNRAPESHGGGASGGVLSSASDNDGDGFKARCASSPRSGCERREIARRRTEEERAEAFFPPRGDNDGDGFKARCASSQERAQTRGDTTIPRVPGPTWTPSTALTSEITMSPTSTRPLSRSTSRCAPSGLSR